MKKRQVMSAKLLRNSYQELQLSASGLVSRCSKKLDQFRAENRTIQTTIDRLQHSRRNLFRSIDQQQTKIQSLRQLSNEYEIKSALETKTLNQRMEHNYTLQKDIDKLKLQIFEMGASKQKMLLQNSMVLEQIKKQNQRIQNLTRQKAELFRQLNSQNVEVRMLRSSERLNKKKYKHTLYRLSLQKYQHKKVRLNLNPEI